MYCIFCKSELICVGSDDIEEIDSVMSNEESTIKSTLTCPECGVYFSQILNKEYEVISLKYCLYENL